MQYFRYLLMIILLLGLVQCGFHLQQSYQLAPALKHIFVQTPDPYGFLARQLQQKLGLAHSEVASQSTDATAILHILNDTESQILLSVSDTQQTRQYRLQLTVEFEITKPNGEIVLPSQTLSESRTITMVANQILGASNIVAAYYQQMRESLANAIIYRLASKEVTHSIVAAYSSGKS